MPTPALPDTRPVASYVLDPLLMKPASGGVLVQDTLLKCDTRDTSSMESTLNFSLSLADPKATVIEPEMEVHFKGRIYKARTILETVDLESGVAGVDVYAERLWYDLLYTREIEAYDYVGAYADEVLASLLVDSEWTVGQVDSEAGLSFSLEAGTPLSAIKSLAAIFTLNVVFDDVNKVVHLVETVGRDRGVYFTYERGVSKATRNVDTTTLVTRLYGKNADGRTIAPANAGVPYVEDFTYTDDIRVAVYNFRSGMSPLAMKNYLLAFLADRSRPNITYEYTPKGLIDRVDEVDRFEVFDQVLVFDTEYAEPVKSMVTQLIIDWVDLRRSTIGLGGRKPSLAASDREGAPIAPDSGEKLQFVQVKNAGVLTLNTLPQAVLTLDFTTVSQTQLQVGMSARIQLIGPTVPVQLTGYFLLNGDRLSEEIAYTATEAGWVTIGLPILVQGVEAENQSLSLYLQVGSGTATIPITGAALWVASSGVAGGGSNTPNRSVRDTIEAWWVWDMGVDVASVWLYTQAPATFALTDDVGMALDIDDTLLTDLGMAWLSPLVSQSGVVFTLTGMIPDSTFAVRLFNLGISYDSTHVLTADSSGAATVNVSTEFSPLAATYSITFSAYALSTLGQTFTVVVP